MMPFYLIASLIILIVFSFVGPTPLKRVCRSLLCAAGAAFVSIFLAIVLYEYTTPTNLGRYGVVSFVCLLIASLFLIWKPFKAKPRNIAVISLVGVILVWSVVILGVHRYHSSFKELYDMVDPMRVSAYEPFKDTSKLAKLTEPALLSFKDNLPRIDGATALYPLYASFVESVYPKGEYDPNEYSLDPDDEDSPSQGVYPNVVLCSSTRQAFENLVKGKADVIFLIGLSEGQEEEAKEAGLNLRLTPIGKEGFVFFANIQNPVTGLTEEEIKGIYSGKITNWEEVGGEDQTIKVFQRAKNSGSQTALERILGGPPSLEPIVNERFDFMSGIYQAVSDYKNYKNALGYSFRYYLQGMKTGEDIRLLSINGIAPAVENIRSGAYPFTMEFYAITVEKPEDEMNEKEKNALKLIEWIRSPQGQFLTEKTGYSPLDPT